MKKLIYLSLITCLFVLLSGFSSFASAKVVETPDVSIIVNGDQPEMGQNPINVNGSTLLPLRQLLINLGVQNDAEHIGWNPKDKSIRIVKDTLTIDLKVNSKTAYVNKKAVTLSTSPVIHKNSVYIPTRFVSECLNKKILWNSSSRSVIITDQAAYDEVRKALDQTSQAMKDIKKVEADFSATVKTKSSEQALSIPVTIAGKIKADSNQKTAYVTLGTSFMGMSINIEEYLVDNVMYMKSNMAEGWTKKSLSKEEIAQMEALYKADSMEIYDEAFCSALKVDKDLSTDEQLVLSGPMVLKALSDQLKQANASANSNVKISKTNCRIYIDRTTNYIDKMEIEMSMEQSLQGSTSTADADMAIEFTKYDGDFTITLPEEAKNAVEME